ncbi:hypothetical protein QOZ80_6AG0533860 [Eleusine coracana subsp. coracana]|nr:hypothetical protein QOZ80_6AG0533860 [Eleusine coracana subsp. coracana]
MERFAAMVASRRTAPAPPPAPVGEEVKENKKTMKKKGMREENEAYLSIQLEEIVIVKNEEIARPCAAAHGGNALGFRGACNRASTSASMEQCAKTPTAPPAGSSTAAAAAARGALTTVARIAGFV